MYCSGWLLLARTNWLIANGLKPVVGNASRKGHLEFLPDFPDTGSLLPWLLCLLSFCAITQGHEYNYPLSPLCHKQVTKLSQTQFPHLQSKHLEHRKRQPQDIPGQLGLRSEFQVSQWYTGRLCVKEKWQAQRGWGGCSVGKVPVIRAQGPGFPSPVPI